MASSSARPHRQARFGVSCRDPYYDYDDYHHRKRSRSSASPAMFNSSNKSKEPQAAKKNLALKNRANAKERAEAVQLQRAINESLLQRSSEANVHLQKVVCESLPDILANVATSMFSHEKSVVDCMDEHTLKTLVNDKRLLMDHEAETARNNCVAFQCLVDVATKAVLESSIHAGESQHARQLHHREQSEEGQVLEPSMGKSPNGKMIEPSGEMIHESLSDEINDELSKCKGYLQDKAKDQINICDDGNSDSSNEWEEGNTEQVDSENESSDLLNDSGCQGRRPVKLQQKAVKDALKVNKFPAQVKKARSARCVLKSKAVSNANLRISVSTPCKRSVKAPAGKENILTSTSMESTKTTESNWKQQIVAENGAAKQNDQSVENFQPCKLHKSQVFDLVSAGEQGSLSVHLQSSTLLHRRVIGLSRRHQPPPLHPYLTKRDR